MRTNVPLQSWTRPDFDEFKEIIRRLDLLDQRFDQPDCPDPSKAAWMKAVEDRLEALEKQPVIP
jgi:predicted alpha/beta hydrolase family esterase